MTSWSLPFPAFVCHQSSRICIHRALEKELRSAPFPVLLICLFICHVQLIQALPGIFSNACLNSAGLEEPLKPNSDISWPTAFLVGEKHPSGSRKVPFISSQGKKSLFCTARPSQWERFCLESPWCSRVKVLQPSPAISVSLKGCPVKKQHFL